MTDRTGNVVVYRTGQDLDRLIENVNELVGAYMDSPRSDMPGQCVITDIVSAQLVSTSGQASEQGYYEMIVLVRVMKPLAYPLPLIEGVAADVTEEERLSMVHKMMEEMGVGDV